MSDVSEGGRGRRSRRVIPGVLSGADLRAVQDEFGVDESQVRRDHVISHCLAALSSIDDSQLVFFGGTALARTHLPALRLSEDIDLIARASRALVASTIQELLTSTLRSLLGVPTFEPALTQTRHAQPSVMSVSDVRIQIQLVAAGGYPQWPTEVAELHQRYADAPPARLRVLTRPAAVAAKLNAWADRAAPRDLYDLWALTTRGYFDDEALALFARYGTLTDAKRVSFAHLPDDDVWHAALRHQGRIAVDAREAAEIVQAAIASLRGLG